jgi:hypothetical protein
MRRHIRVGAALCGLAFVLTCAEPALRADAKSSVEEIRKELMQLDATSRRLGIDKYRFRVHQSN